MKPVVALCMTTTMQKRLFDRENMKALKSVARKVVAHDKDTKPDLADLTRLLRDADAAITTWGSPCFTAEVLALAPKLKLIAHSAGSVKAFVSDAVWARDIRVTQAAAGIAVAVAEYTLLCVLAGLKDSYRINQKLRAGGEWWDTRKTSREMNKKTLGIIGASHVGRNVIRLLKNFNVTILLFDPYVNTAKAKELGVRKVTLAQLLKTSDVVSLHAPSTPATKGMLGAKEFALMKDNAVFINTARGACIDEPALVGELQKGRFMAFIDVTEPEPPVAGHPFYSLPNVVLTPHIAGTVSDFTPLAALAIDEVKLFAAKKPARFGVSKEMLAKIG